MDHNYDAPLPGPETRASPLERPFAPEIQRAVDLLQCLLDNEPDVGATLLPGYVITPKPMSPAERAARYLPRANEKRRSDNQERLAGLRHEIARQLATEPTMTSYHLAIALNAAGLTTYSGLRFTATRVDDLLKRLRRTSAV